MTALQNLSRATHRLCVQTLLCASLTLGAALLGLSGTVVASESPVTQTRVQSSVQGSIKPLPADWHKGVFMEIFVRGWRDSNGDGIGDLKGLTQSLDYLQTLGVRGIWLMPITRSADHDHGYSTLDFHQIEPAYGTMADFDELIREAHQRGIGVIMDYVINHSSSKHPFFIESKNRKSPKRDWYVWQDTAPKGWNIWGKNPWYTTPNGVYYGTFGRHMPDFNFRHPSVVQYHLDEIKFWLDRGIDGFRFDAVPHLIENSAKDWNDQPESYALMRQIFKAVHNYPNKFVVCEATANPIEWAAPDVCGSAFAFGLERPMIEAARGEIKGIEGVASYFEKAPVTMSTMLANHDIFAGQRVFDQLKGDQAQMRLAASTLLLLPGRPFLYYGEEFGMGGAMQLKEDPQLRIPMSWRANAANAGFTAGKPFRAVASNVMTHNVEQAQSQQDGLLAHYRRMIALRNAHPALAQGAYRNAKVQDKVLSFERFDQTTQLLVVINYDTQSRSIQLPSPLNASAQTKLVPLPNQTATTELQVNPEGQFSLEIAPQTAVVYQIQP